VKIVVWSEKELKNNLFLSPALLNKKKPDNGSTAFRYQSSVVNKSNHITRQLENYAGKMHTMYFHLCQLKVSFYLLCLLHKGGIIDYADLVTTLISTK
jgi:hypothetical protein